MDLSNFTFSSFEIVVPPKIHSKMVDGWIILYSIDESGKEYCYCQHCPKCDCHEAAPCDGRKGIRMAKITDKYGSWSICNSCNHEFIC